MPFDPTLPLKVRSPEYHSPLDSYARFLTLREMMDRRQFADQQRQWQTEDRTRMQSLRDLLQSNPNASYGEIAAYDIGSANSMLKARTEAATQKRLEEKARLEGIEQTQKIGATEKETAFNELAGIQAIADPDAKGQAFMEWMGKYQGLGFPRQAGWPMNEQTMEFIGKSGLGPGKWQTLVDARRKAQAEQEDRAHKLAVTQPLEEREQRATTERAEQLLTGMAKPSPAALPALYETWLPGWLAKNKLPDTPENRALSVERYHELLGLSQGMTPEAAAQAVKLAGEKARAEAEAAKNKPNAEFQKKILALKNLRSAIAAYRTELSTTGPTLLPGKGARLNSLYRDLQLQQKEAAQLGALAGPDVGILEKLMTPPDSYLGNWMGSTPLLSQLDVGNEVLTRGEKNLREVYGVPAENPAPPPPAPPTGGMKNKSNDELFRILSGGRN